MAKKSQLDDQRIVIYAILAFLVFLTFMVLNAFQHI